MPYSKREDNLYGRINAFAEYLEGSPKYSASTKFTYVSRVHQLVSFFPHRDIWSLSEEDLKKFFNRPRGYKGAKKDRAPSLATKKSEEDALICFYTFCSKKFKTSNPMQGWERTKRPQRNPKPVPREVIAAALRQERNLSHRLAILLAADGTCRLSGVASLRWRHVSWQGNDPASEAGWLAIIEKGNKERIVPFQGRLGRALRQQWERHRERWQGPLDELPNLWVVTDRYLTGYTTRALWDVIVTSFRRIGYQQPRLPHSLRASCAQALVEAGTDLPTLMDLMGWERADTALHYIRTYSESKERAIANINGGSTDVDPRVVKLLKEVNPSLIIQLLRELKKLT